MPLSAAPMTKRASGFALFSAAVWARFGAGFALDACVCDCAARLTVEATTAAPSASENVGRIVRSPFSSALRRNGLLLADSVAMRVPIAHSSLWGSDTMRIGIIGAGMIGSTLAKLWADAGHTVLIASRHPEELELLAEKLGKNASAGAPVDAAAFGEAILLTVPLVAVP